MNYKLWWTLVMCMVKFSKAARKMCACIWDPKLFWFDLNPIKGKPTLWCPNNLIVTFSSDGTKFWLGFFLFVGTIVKWAATDIWRWAASTRLASPRRSRARSSVSWILRQFQGFVLKSTWMCLQFCSGKLNLIGNVKLNQQMFLVSGNVKASFDLKAMWYLELRETRFFFDSLFLVDCLVAISEQISSWRMLLCPWESARIFCVLSCQRVRIFLHLFDAFGLFQ